MKPLTEDDLLSIESFKADRPRHERVVLAARRLRTVPIGPHMTALFENRLTMWWQVQEMCRVEHITAPAAVAHELETYNRIIPGERELSATLLVEVEDPAARGRLLRDLVGIWDHLWLKIGDRTPIKASFDDEQFDTTRISAVQFVRFRLSEADQQAFLDLSVPAALAVDHPAYQAEAPLALSTRGALVEDLRG